MGKVNIAGWTDWLVFLFSCTSRPFFGMIMHLAPFLA